MSGYLLYLLLAIILVIFWRAWAGRTVDRMLDDSRHHHHQVLAANERHPTGGNWAEHRRWMAEKE